MLTLTDETRLADPHTLLLKGWISSRKYISLRASQQCSGYPTLSAIITALRDALFSILLYHSAQFPLMFTRKAKSAQITRRQEMYM